MNPDSTAVPPPIWLIGVSIAIVLWAFYPTLDWLVGKWYADPSYSHGFLVPFIAAYIIYRKRSTITQWFGTPKPMAASGIFVAILLFRGLAGGLLFNQLDALALLLTLVTSATKGFLCSSVNTPVGDCAFREVPNRQQRRMTARMAVINRE